MHQSAAVEISPPANMSAKDLETRVRGHVHLLEGGVVFYKERPWLEPNWTREVMRQFHHHMQHNGARCLLLDLTDGCRPDAEVRQILRDGMKSLVDMDRVVLATGGNALLNVAIKFIFRCSFQGKVQVFNTLSQARQAVYHG